ncbi:MAG: biopolymer transporter [Desulfobacterales bacterium C00003060]|nr:MAG: biopolymer transporter [Desulfobacterales bacterium S3730MH5]OEU77555.1 MAG: biopolymer transporter [Desulfobacterales bacterium C00003060]OEU84989.1 MAG: biopolymer transporter [Desulfobacterales bacterium S5133MH4]
MDVGALLKSLIYVISSSLLYPVLFLLVLLTLWILIYSGSFFAEWLERLRLARYPSEELPQMIKQGNHRNVFSHRVNSYVDHLRRVLGKGNQPTEAEIENIIQEKSLSIWKSLDRLKIVVRIGPGLGLIGTLIPMGTGLAALGQGDMTKLSSDLVIAFTTTVVGLAVGIMAYFFYTIKRSWAEEDVKNIELATEILAGKVLEEKDSAVL